MKNILRMIFAAALAASLFSVSSLAAAPQQDASGTWTWTISGRGKSAEQTLNLVVTDGLVTGTIGGGAIPEAPITNAVLKGDSITFNVVRQRGGNTFTTTYTGKIKGNTITGSYKATASRGGETRSIPWEAMRTG